MVMFAVADTMLEDPAVAGVFFPVKDMAENMAMIPPLGVWGNCVQNSKVRVPWKNMVAPSVVGKENGYAPVQMLLINFPINITRIEDLLMVMLVQKEMICIIIARTLLISYCSRSRTPPSSWHASPMHSRSRGVSFRPTPPLGPKTKLSLLDPMNAFIQDP